MSSTAHANALEGPTSAPVVHVRPDRYKLNAAAKAAVSGNPVEIRQFVCAMTPLVCSICRGIMGRQHPDLEDAIQESLVLVVRALPQFRFESDIAHYITKIVMRNAISARRKAQSRSSTHDSLDDIDLPLANTDEGIETRADLIRKLLDNLNKEQANALRLRLMMGHSMNEIAQITGVSLNTVKTRLRLGKTQLRQWLIQRGEGPRDRR